MARKLAGQVDMAAMLERMAAEMSAWQEGDQLFLVGIRTRGEPLARRLASLIAAKSGLEPPVGVLDITLYRDDLALQNSLPRVKGTTLPGDITGKVVVIVDDVLFTGRTIRSALTELLDYGRPKAIRLAVLVDRKCRELPIQADVVGLTVDTHSGQSVNVRLKEIDGTEEVLLEE